MNLHFGMIWSSGPILGPQTFLDCNSQKPAPLSVLTRASGACNPIMSGDPRLGTMYLELPKPASIEEPISRSMRQIIRFPGQVTRWKRKQMPCTFNSCLEDIWTGDFNTTVPAEISASTEQLNTRILSSSSDHPGTGLCKRMTLRAFYRIQLALFLNQRGTHNRHLNPWVTGIRNGHILVFVYKYPHTGGHNEGPAPWG